MIKCSDVSNAWCRGQVFMSGGNRPLAVIGKALRVVSLLVLTVGLSVRCAEIME